MGAKVRFSVTIGGDTGRALEALAVEYKPPFSKSYLVKFAELPTELRELQETCGAF